jgi:acyl-CoA synthetase (NDP forming)
MHKLERLLRPRSIAVFGGVQAERVVAQSIEMGFAGDIWPVHPNKHEVAGCRVYRSVADLPGAPDAAWVGVNRHRSIEVIRALAQRGAGGAVCYAAGFRETGAYEEHGEGLQARLVAAAGGMPIIGPNCYGLINYADGALLWPDNHGGRRLAEGDRGVAIITQSSSLAMNITMQRRGLPIAFLMTAGNQAQTGLSEMVQGLLADDRVSAIGFHIEAFDSVAGFERLAAQARALKKPIVAMKVGRSAQAQQATVSHTASLAGCDAAASAFLKRLGIARLDTLPSFIEALKLLHVAGPLSGYRLSSMSCSGGEASIIADSAEGRAVYFPPLADQHHARLTSILGPLVAVANPLDYNTYIWRDEPAMTEVFIAMVAGPFDLNMLTLDFPRSDRCPGTEAYGRPNLRAFVSALRTNNAHGALVTTLPENLPEDRGAALISQGVAPLCGISEALDAAGAAAFIGDAWRRPQARPIDAVASFAFGGDNMILDEAEAKRRLIADGLPVPKGERAGSVADAVGAAVSLGFPVALKALGISHKSDLGAVRLNLQNVEAVEAAARELLEVAAEIYVERMVMGGVAELIVGFSRDPLFGGVLTLGTGGVLVELLRDSVTLLLPVTREDIELALRRLNLFPLLDGFRGRPCADIEAAIDAITGIFDFVQRSGGAIREFDVNPLIVCAKGNGAWIADALLMIGEEKDD